MNSKASPKKNCLMIILAFLTIADKHAKADLIFGTPIKVPNVNVSSVDVGNPEISSDGLALYYNVHGSGASDIWVTTRGTTDDNWGAPVNLGPPVNSPAYEGQPSISANGLELYFADGSYSTLGPYRPGGHGGSDLWVSRRATTDDPWGEPDNLGPIVNSSDIESDPEISADGLTLLFNSNRSSDNRYPDIWVTTRPTKDSRWTEPVKLGSNINTIRYDGDPDISADGLSLFFCSFGDLTGFGGVDLWISKRANINDPWSEPVNLGPIVNTAYSDSDTSISADGSMLYFSSNRSGYYEIWHVSIEPNLDFNGDLKIDLADMHIMVDSWGTDKSLCDIAPMPWGDSVVDVKDINVLAEHLFEDYRMVAHWKLDETEGEIAHDSVGDNDAVVLGKPAWLPTGGMMDGTLLLDGVDDCVDTPFILNTAEESVSVFAWIYSGAPGQVIISQRGDFGRAWLGINPSDGKLMTGISDMYLGALVSETVITDFQWHHVGLVYDLDSLHRRLYVDGVQVAEDVTVVPGMSSDGGLYIGASKYLDAGTFFSGLIDDVRIYNVALTAEEIAALAQ